MAQMGVFDFFESKTTGVPDRLPGGIRTVLSRNILLYALSLLQARLVSR